MTQRDRPGRGWNEAEIEERERLASSRPPTDTEFDREITLNGHSNGNGEHRESYPERMPPPLADDADDELPRPDLRTSRPPAFDQNSDDDKPYDLRDLERILTAASVLRHERLRLAERQIDEARFAKLDAITAQNRRDTRDDIRGLEEKLKLRDEIAEVTREKDRRETADWRASFTAEMRARTPGRVLIGFVVLLVAALAFGAITAGNALTKMARDMAKQQERDR